MDDILPALPCFRVFYFLSRYRSALPATFLLPAYPLQGSSPFGVFRFLYDNPSSHKLNGRLMFGPSFLKKKYYDLCWLLSNQLCITTKPCSLRSRSSSRQQCDRSPRVRTWTFSPYTCRIYSGMFRIVWGFVLLCRLTHIQLPNSLPVRQARDLPPASFRFLLTEDTLALS